MLNNKEKSEIRDHLEKAQNPVFFFDNDQDGLCSFLLLQRHIERGKGVSVKSFPDMTVDYFRKVLELNSDYIFILDKPLVSEEFFKEARKMNIPIVWIDHHEVPKDIPKYVNYYNPLKNGDTHEPVTALCYDVISKKEDSWISVMGCVADKFLPKEYKTFLEKYPELGIKTSEPYDVLYKSEIGKASKIIRAGLMDKTTNVVSMMKYLMKVKSPQDILEENSKNSQMHERFKEINTKYQKYLGKAVEGAEETIIFHKYSGSLSISSELSNELFYRFPEKRVFVCYVSSAKINISARGKNIREIVLEVIKDLPGATGGGHECAVGAQIKKDDLDKFEITLRELLKKDKYIKN